MLKAIKEFFLGTAVKVETPVISVAEVATKAETVSTPAKKKPTVKKATTRPAKAASKATPKATAKKATAKKKAPTKK